MKFIRESTKSWPASHLFTPEHASGLVLVWALAYAFVLSLGPLALEEPPVAAQVLDKHCSVFRHGLRLWALCLGQGYQEWVALTQAYFVFLDPHSLKSL
jgi:hypothetical protein